MLSQLRLPIRHRNPRLLRACCNDQIRVGRPLRKGTICTLPGTLRESSRRSMGRCTAMQRASSSQEGPAGPGKEALQGSRLVLATAA